MRAINFTQHVPTKVPFPTAMWDRVKPKGKEKEHACKHQHLFSNPQETMSPTNGSTHSVGTRLALAASCASVERRAPQVQRRDRGSDQGNRGAFFIRHPQRLFVKVHIVRSLSRPQAAFRSGACHPRSLHSRKHQDTLYLAPSECPRRRRLPASTAP
jgi:hypothetical protein